jgi:serine/threonine-protein kinase
MIRLRALGAIDLRRADDAPVDAVLRQPKRTALLTYIAASPQGRPRRRDEIVAMFWPEADDRHARDSLSAALGFLRRSLGDGVLVGRGEEEIGCSSHHLSADIAEFLQAIDQGRHESALSLYQGDLLPGLNVPGAAGFEEWLESERARLRGRAAAAAASLAVRAVNGHQPSEAVAYARRAAELAPDDEQMVRRLIGLQEAAGDRAGALRSYETFARRLAAEYDAEPSDETRALVARMRGRCDVGARPRGETASDTPLPSADVLASAVPATTSAPRARSFAGRSPLLLLLPLLLGAVAIAWGAINRNESTLADSPMRIAVFPFAVHGSEDLKYLEEGSMDVLSGTIDGMGELRSVDPRAVMSRLRRLRTAAVTPDAARIISSELSAGRYVVGSITALGDRIRMSARLYDRRPGSEPLALADVEGPPAGLSDMYSTLTRRLFAHQPVGTGERLLSVSVVRAGNHAAERAYLEGEAMMRRGVYDSAAVSFTRAVEEDSTFALAWYRLSLANGFGVGADSRPAADAALRYPDRLSPRDRLLADAANASSHGDGERWERSARDVVSAYPDNVEGWWMLGTSLWWHAWQRGRPVSDARAPLERALRLDPDHREALHALHVVSGMERRYPEAHTLGERAYALGGPLAANLVSRDAVSAFTGSDRAARDSVLGQLRRSPNFTVLQSASFVASWADDMDNARQVAHLLTEASDRSMAARAQGHVLSAFIELAAGRRRAAAAQFAFGTADAPALATAYEAFFSAFPPFALTADELRASRERLLRWSTSSDKVEVAFPWFKLPGGLAPELRVYGLGLIDARLGDVDGALRHAAALESARSPADSSGFLADLALEIRALVAAAEGDTARALRLIEQQGLRVSSHYQVAAPLYERPFGRFLRAEFLHALGRNEEALGWYATLTTLSMIEFPMLAPAYLRQGEIHERQGHRSLALEYYARFVNRWADCDPELRDLVDEVRARADRLNQEERKPSPRSGVPKPNR